MRPSTTSDAERAAGRTTTAEATTTAEPTTTARTTRRRALRLAGAAVPTVALAGCTDLRRTVGGEDSDGGSDDGPDEDLPDDPEPVSVRLVGPDSDHHLFDGEGVENVGTVTEDEGHTHYYVPMTLIEERRESMAETFREAGVADDHEAFEIVVGLGDEELTRLRIAAGLAETIADGDWSGEFRVTFEEREEAERFRRHLVA